MSRMRLKAYMGNDVVGLRVGWRYNISRDMSERWKELLQSDD